MDRTPRVLTSARGGETLLRLVSSRAECSAIALPAPPGFVAFDSVHGTNGVPLPLEAPTSVAVGPTTEKTNQVAPIGLLVGARGFEPPTPTTPR